jgi:flavin-dependent dehydrogenase
MYDVLVVGGGIAGSIAARFAAENGFSTLLIEKAKTPRNKPCSGIQFPYFEKLVGAKIPPEALCKNDLSKIEMVTPKGRMVNGQMRMLNFQRSTFDSWLNTLAMESGAEFQDGIRLEDFQTEADTIRANLIKGTQRSEVTARYLIVADGLQSGIRKQLRPQDFQAKATSGTMNFHFKGDSKLDPNTLYMYYQREFSNLMFAYAYLKDDVWVIGSGADPDPLAHATRFYDYMHDRYSLNGEIVRREGFGSGLKPGVYPGTGNVLLAGDAAGFGDLYRGVGMDNAAISARLAVKAIQKASLINEPAADIYAQLISGMIRKIDKNEIKARKKFATNETLEKSLTQPRLIRDGISMMVVNQINRLLPPEKMILLPI